MTELFAMTELTGTTDIRETVREKYAAAARAASRGACDQARALESGSGCRGPEGISCSPADATGVFGPTQYDEAHREDVPAVAVSASLGCGVPTAVADLHEGETVLDLGSGGGIDVLISARRVGPTGTAIGLDMTDEMLALARGNACGGRRRERRVPEAVHRGDAAARRVGRRGEVINLSADKPRVIREAARVLRPGGRFAISDVIAAPVMDQATRADMAAWTGCVAGALTEAQFRVALSSAGFEGIEILETHRVQEHAAWPTPSCHRRSADRWAD